MGYCTFIHSCESIFFFRHSITNAFYTTFCTHAPPLASPPGRTASRSTPLPPTTPLAGFAAPEPRRTPTGHTRTTAALRVRDKSLRAPALARARSAADASRAEPRTHEPPRRSELTCRPVPPHRPEPMADAGPMANAGPMADAGLRQGSAAPPLTSGLPRGLCLIWGDGVKSTPRTHGVTPRVRAACTSSYRAASAVQGGN
jgi:hypothetical protein